MARFSLVPTEIIDQILKFVPRPDLASLCRVNKSLHQSAELFLYSSIEIIWDKKHQKPSIAPLLRTLFHRPELLSYVDEVHLHGAYFPDDLERPLLDTATADIPLDEFINIINKTKVSYADLWVERLRSGHMDAFAGLLIANLAKISYLDITHNFINGNDILSEVLLSKVFGQLPTFDHLKKMVYAKRLDYKVWERNEISLSTMSLFYLPAVTDMTVRMSNPDVFEWLVDVPTLNYLTSLDIGWFVEPYMAQLLPCVPNLKSLYWSWIYHQSPNEDMEETILDFNKIVEILSNIKESLETFVFSMEIGGDDYERKVDDMEFLGSFRGLREFKQLKYLSIPLVCLAGFGSEPIPLEQSTPAGLEVIHLRWEDLSGFGVEVGWRNGNLFDHVRPMIQPLVENSPNLHLLTAVRRKMEVRTKLCAPDCHP
ncbi:unnamed protein product [Clonostachys rhizophaga]|uniref:F-box domain-containing protein n=1 Tax=Clonostachys rhizophaga TaxID=160324 RepID=A0A9N9VQQ2_9HYPO|nr:unnamed protein product [Clonostachys rhizophaga]